MIARPLKKSLCAFHSNAICACLCPQNIAFSRLMQMFDALCRYLMHCVQIPDADGQWAKSSVICKMCKMPSSPCIPMMQLRPKEIRHELPYPFCRRLYLIHSVYSHFHESPYKDFHTPQRHPAHPSPPHYPPQRLCCFQCVCLE